MAAIPRRKDVNDSWGQYESWYF